VGEAEVREAERPPARLLDRLPLDRLLERLPGIDAPGRSAPVTVGAAAMDRLASSAPAAECGTGCGCR